MTVEHANIVRDLRQPDIRGPAKAVLLVLALRADQTGCCWPSVETVAQDAGLSVTATKQALRHLVALGLISRQTRSRGARGRGSSWTVMHLLPSDLHGSVDAISNLARRTPDALRKGAKGRVAPLVRARGTLRTERETPPKEKLKSPIKSAHGCPPEDAGAPERWAQPISTAQSSDAFDRFWATCQNPALDRRSSARRAFEALVAAGTSPEWIIAEAQRNTPTIAPDRWLQRYVPLRAPHLE